MHTYTLFWTGASGFLGRHWISSLADFFPHVHFDIYCLIHHNRPVFKDLSSAVRIHECSMNDLDVLFQTQMFDAVIHTATHYGRSQDSTWAQLETNVFLPVKLMELALKNPHLLFLNTDTILDKRISDYSLSKHQFDEWTRHFCEKNKQLTVISAALEHFYGPGDTPSKFTTFIFQSLLNNVDHLDLTPGEQLRYFIYIDDACSALNTLLSHHLLNASHELFGYHRYEIGHSQASSVKNFVETVKKINQSTTVLNFGAIDYRPYEVMHPSINLTPLLNLGWSPSISLEEGIRKTLKADALNQSSTLKRKTS